MPEGRLARGVEKQFADFWWSKRGVFQKTIWITRHPDHKRVDSGQNEELSKKRFGKVPILTIKGLFLVKTKSYPKKDLDYSPS
ncbi:MAG: hypothetical protein QM270_09450 [Bacillota bacterium]|nr:hypothetical protein [Bacillota bacterium]